MINIVSKSHLSKNISGPKKVADNLIEGLKLIGYPFVVNRRLDACARLWIHDDVRALWEIKNLPPEIKVVAGPNLFLKPERVPGGLDLSRAVFLQPSQWSLGFWKDFGFRSCPLESWPVGIDTYEFAPQPGQKNYILVYFKQRAPAELEFVKRELAAAGLAYKVLSYPSYSEKQYKKLLGQARYVVWLGRHESQGIALEEALSCGVPAVVCDVVRIGDWTAGKKEQAQFTAEENAYAKATSAEYFDAGCGTIIKKLADFRDAITQMEQNLGGFRPREYILKNLSLEKQARDFVEIYNKYFALSFERGLTEPVLRKGDWINNSPASRLKFLAKDAAKYALKFVNGRSHN